MDKHLANSLDNYLTTDPRDTWNDWECAPCGFTFENQKLYDSHMATIHEGV